MVIKYEVWVLTAGIYKRILFNNLADATFVNKSIEVRDEWID